MASKVGISHYYETIYRSTSSAVHGTWHHLKTYYLTETGNSFEPEISSFLIKPQLFEGTSFVALKAAKNYTDFILDSNCLSPLFTKYLEWLRDMGEEHEKFLSTM